jgi:hypothetical protein
MTDVRALPDAWRQLEELWRAHGFTRWPASPGPLPDPILEPRLYFSLFSEASLATWSSPELFRPAGARLDGEGSFVLSRVLYRVERPAPAEGSETVLESLAAVGVDLAGHDFRAVARSWRSEELGLARSGWSGRLDGTEVARVTWVDEVAGVVLERPVFELWLWLDRLPLSAPREMTEARSSDLDWPQVRSVEEAELSAAVLAEAEARGSEERFDGAIGAAERALSIGAPRAAWPAVVEATIALEWIRRVQPPGAAAARASRLAEAVVRCTDAVRRGSREGLRE